MLNDINFFQNDQITGISETNNDFIPQLNSEDNIISSPIHYSTELQDNINSFIEGMIIFLKIFTLIKIQR